MISFIIIGKNEKRTIKLSIDSVINTILKNNIIDYEIIYIDSKSSDNSIEIVKNFKIVNIYSITGVANAAIARNIGAIESKGDILWFLDGDMELNENFYCHIIKNEKLIYPFISGQMKNIFHNKEWEKVDENFMYQNLENDKYTTTTGGFFVIDRNAWFKVEGMKTKYRRSQDIDLGLRLSQVGIKLLRKKELMVKHLTIHYQSNERMWKMLFNGSLLFHSSVLYRDHVLNPHIYKIIFRNSYTLFFLIVSIILSNFCMWSLLLHPFLLLIRIVLQTHNTDVIDMLRRFAYYYLLDLQTLIGFFFFFPKSHKITYKKYETYFCTL